MKRGLFRTEAIVLNSFDYGESDRILTFYTIEHGKIKGIAKGARRSKKRFVNNLEPLSHIKLIFFHTEKSELVRVEDSTLLDGFASLRTDIERLSQACYLIELVAEMTREGQALSSVFDLLLAFLEMLSSGAGQEPLLRFFEIRLLSILGYQPYLNGCVSCKGVFGDTADGGFRKFSSEKGGALCTKCSNSSAGALTVSPGTLRLLSMAIKFDTGKLSRLKPDAIFLEESEKVLYAFIKHQIGKELKTKKFMEKMKGPPAGIEK